MGGTTPKSTMAVKVTEIRGGVKILYAAINVAAAAIKPSIAVAKAKRGTSCLSKVLSSIRESFAIPILAEFTSCDRQV